MWTPSQDSLLTGSWRTARRQPTVYVPDECVRNRHHFANLIANANGPFFSIKCTKPLIQKYLNIFDVSIAIKTWNNGRRDQFLWYTDISNSCVYTATRSEQLAFVLRKESWECCHRDTICSRAICMRTTLTAAARAQQLTLIHDWSKRKYDWQCREPYDSE